MVQKDRVDPCVELDLNSPVFQKTWSALPALEQRRALATFEKIIQLSWDQLYRDKGLRWEKIRSVPPPPGVDALYSFRVSKSIRAVGFRDGTFLRVLLVDPDHDRAYGKK